MIELLALPNIDKSLEETNLMINMWR